MKCYYIGEPYNGGGIAYILDNRKEALKLKNDVAKELCLDFIDVRVHVLKNANIEGLPKGRIDDSKCNTIDFAKRKIFDDSEVFDKCTCCGNEDYLSIYVYTENGKDKDTDYICEKCSEKENDRD